MGASPFGGDLAPVEESLDVLDGGPATRGRSRAGADRGSRLRGADGDGEPACNLGVMDLHAETMQQITGVRFATTDERVRVLDQIVAHAEAESL